MRLQQFDRRTVVIFAGLLALSLFAVGVNALTVVMLIPLSGSVLGESLGQDSFILQLISRIIDINLHTIIILILALIATHAALELIRNAVIISLVEFLRRIFQMRMAGFYIHQPFSEIARKPKGQLLENMIKNTANALRLIKLLLNFLNEVLIFLIMLATAASVHWQLVAVTIAGFAIVALILGVPYIRMGIRLGQRQVQYQQKLASEMTTLLTDLKEIKIAFAHRFRLQLLDRLSLASFKIISLAKLFAILPSLAIVSVLALLFLIAFVVINPSVHAIEANIPLILFGFGIGYKLLGAATNITKLFYRIGHSRYAFDLVMDIVTQPFVPESARSGIAAPTELKQGLRFDHVDFAWGQQKNTQRHSVLRSCSFSIKAGRTVLLSGKSGSGKTTIVDLIVRLYQPDSGSILVDGQEVSKLDLASWRRQIGYVAQGSAVFSGSLRDNIALDRSALDDARILAALKMAGLQDFCANLPGGLSYKLREGGGNLSEGQCKRIVLARTLVRKPSILIIDEAFSGIEEALEAQILSDLKRENPRITIIIISHRASTHDLVDDILLVHNGIVEPIHISRA